MMGTDLPSHNALATALRSVGEAAAKNRQSGKEALLRVWPYTTESRVARSVSDRDKLHIFNADGFRCRYTGELLLLPAFLRTLSALYPYAFPYHPNWKSEETHPAYWWHTASLEHVTPNSIGGAEHRDNWVTTSMARNQVRSRFSLEVLGWKLHPRSVGNEWDGGVGAFIALSGADDVETHPLHGSYIIRWRKLVLEV